MPLPPTVDVPSFDMMERRDFLTGACLLSIGLIGASGCTAKSPNDDEKTMLTIYSPAPPNNPMHTLNLLLAEAASEGTALAPMEIPPMALPQSINTVSGKPPEERSRYWPIVTTVDFAPARLGAGPDWHGYPRPCPDLKFVSRLYDVGFGIALWGEAVTGPDQLRGKRIAVPPRPSAVRLMTEVLLRDGWGIADEVTLIDMIPPQIAAARAAGDIDGTSWNLAVPGEGGHRPMLPADPNAPLHYAPVEAAALARINAANPFTLSLSQLVEGAPPLLSFAQALAVWDESDGTQIGEMLEFIEANGSNLPGFPKSVAEMASWPGLTSDAIHPIARAFFKARGIEM